MDLVLGILAAVGASTLYSLGIALQAMDAREAPHEAHLRLELARELVRRGRWRLGTAAEACPASGRQRREQWLASAALTLQLSSASAARRNAQ